MVGRLTDSDLVLDTLSREAITRLAPLGTSCPDHFIRTKVRPLLLDLPPTAPVDDLVARLGSCTPPTATTTPPTTAATPRPTRRPCGAPDPVIVLVPGVGMFSFGADARAARIAGEFYVNAINVMRGAEAVSTYAPIDEAEKFRIEYWELEEAKLRRLPPPKPLAGRVAFVTGAASGHRPGHRRPPGPRARRSCSPTATSPAPEPSPTSWGATTGAVAVRGRRQRRGRGRPRRRRRRPPPTAASTWW